MNNVVIFTIIVALLVSFVAFPMASGDSGLHKGWESGEGHENYQVVGTRRIHFDDVETAAELVRLREGLQ